MPVKVVSERLGHANPAFTISVYQHVIPGMQAEAAATFSDLLYGSTDGDVERSSSEDARERSDEHESGPGVAGA